MKTDLELISVIDETTLIYVRSGELFARVPLNNQLSEDTDAGKLILTSVRTILIAPINSRNRQVNFNVDALVLINYYVVV